MNLAAGGSLPGLPLEELAANPPAPAGGHWSHEGFWVSW